MVICIRNLPPEQGMTRREDNQAATARVLVAARAPATRLPHKAAPLHPAGFAVAGPGRGGEGQRMPRVPEPSRPPPGAPRHVRRHRTAVIASQLPRCRA